MLRKSVQLVHPVFKTNQFLIKVNDEILTPKRWAGHSKWQNIQHTKAQKDYERNLNFQRLGKRIALAVKEGGDNPQANYKLRAIIEECRKSCMPNSTIEQFIKASKNSSMQKPYWIVFSGVKGLLLGAEVGFSNAKHACTILLPFLKKISMKFEKRVDGLMEEKGIICCEYKKGEGQSYDKAVEDALEIGIDEVEEGENQLLMFECKPSMIDIAHKKLLDKGYNIISATNELQFNSFVKLSDTEKTAVQNTIEKIQKQCDEVIRIVHNVEEED